MAVNSSFDFLVFVRRAVIHLSLVALAIVTLTPMVWLFAAVLKHPAYMYTYTFFGPWTDDAGEHVYSFHNFRNLFASIPFFRFVINSFFVTSVTVLIQLFLASLAGFALAKYNFRGKKLIMILMLVTMMIPGQVMLAPLYELIYRIGLVDTYMGLIIPGAVNVFGIFLFRQSMLPVPDDLLNAGRVDGCSEFRLYWEVILPVSRPMIGAFTLIAFMGAWNSFLWPQIILQTQDRFTLPIGINQMAGVYERNDGAIMAGTFLAVIPVVALFFALQREFVAGLTSGAVKG